MRFRVASIMLGACALALPPGAPGVAGMPCGSSVMVTMPPVHPAHLDSRPRETLPDCPIGQSDLGKTVYNGQGQQLGVMSGLILGESGEPKAIVVTIDAAAGADVKDDAHRRIALPKALVRRGGEDIIVSIGSVSRPDTPSVPTPSDR